LASQGHDAVHVRDANLANKPDHAISSWAIAETRVLITQDADFDQPQAPLRVLKLGLGNASVAVLLAWLGPKLADAIARLDHGETHITLD
jgi:predicted nuclease of predicted toxin-antitoxin system